MPRAGEPSQVWEPHGCWDSCWDEKRKRWKIGERTRRGCTRRDLPRVPWRVDVTRLRVYQGRDPDPELDHQRWELPATARNSLHQPWWRTPGEEPGDGCPGGWIRTPLADSIYPYLRTRTEGGGRVQNMRLDECEDRLVKDAVLYFEECEERRIAYGHRLYMQSVEAERKSRSGGST